MSGTQETALTLARELSGAGEAEEALLELLCQAAEQQWEKRLRPGMTTEDCGKAFPCAVAFTAAADLAAARGGEGVSGFTAGSVSVPMTERDERARSDVTSIGWVDGRLWLYLGQTALEEGEALAWEATRFRVRSCRPYYIGNALSHYWAALEQEREAAECGS